MAALCFLEKTMKKYNFISAKPIFYPYGEKHANEKKKYSVAHYGFYKSITLNNEDLADVNIAISAQNMYRLYINEEFVMQGPRRTAHGYLRVDEIDISSYLCVGQNHVAVELIEYGDAYNGYSNDSTLEDAMLIYEIKSGKSCLASTGVDDICVCRLDYRVKKSERISHSRQALEIYNFSGGENDWMVGKASFKAAAKINEEKIYLYTSLPFPTLKKHIMDNIILSGGCYIDENKSFKQDFYESEKYFAKLDELAFVDCRKTVDTEGDGLKVEQKEGEINITSDGDSYIMLDLGVSEVGLLSVDLESDGGTIDFVRSEMLNTKGKMPHYFGTVSRINTLGGNVKHIFFEAGLYRYLKIYFRGCKNIRIKDISVLEYYYPDNGKCGFECSDIEANILYAAAKRTLLFNTLDVFMDCPDRERGGWLCDSLWTARAASLMLSDDRVEREMIESFMLTDENELFYGFFPEVYPANKGNYKKCAGITTWSFWLMCELCEYVARTGDKALALEFKDRVEKFVHGSSSFIGKSGMLENMPFIFVDWSLSNHNINTQPISVAANALYSYMLISLGKLYENDEWVNMGNGVKKALRAAIEANKNGNTFPDSFEFNKNGMLVPRGFTTESCTYTALWSYLYNKEENSRFIGYARDYMGTCPKYPADPNIGKSNLFIGLCIRLDMLSRFGEFDIMYKDLKDIYMWQIKEGPGTLWETNGINASSRCHGFSSHAGVHLLRDVVGFEEINREKGYIKISPHLCSLEWARGFADIDGYKARVEWRIEDGTFYLDVDLPKNYRYAVTLPHEVRHGKVKSIVTRVNGEIK